MGRTLERELLNGEVLEICRRASKLGPNTDLHTSEVKHHKILGKEVPESRRLNNSWSPHWAGNGSDSHQWVWREVSFMYTVHCLESSERCYLSPGPKGALDLS